MGKKIVDFMDDVKNSDINLSGYNWIIYVESTSANHSPIKLLVRDEARPSIIWYEDHVEIAAFDQIITMAKYNVAFAGASKIMNIDEVESEKEEKNESTNSID